MARKPLFETLLQQVSENFASIVIIAIGTVAFYYFTRRKPNVGPRPPPGALPPRNSAPSEGGAAALPRAAGSAAATQSSLKPSAEMSVLQRIKEEQFVGSKVCVVWEIFYKDGQWADNGKARDVLACCAMSSDLYVMCKVGGEEQEKEALRVLKKVEGIQRHKVLFCTTQKGYEAFTRQINPALLITNNKPEAVFLSGVLPYIALVGEGDVGKPNVACVPTAYSLAYGKTA